MNNVYQPALKTGMLALLLSSLLACSGGDNSRIASTTNNKTDTDPDGFGLHYQQQLDDIGEIDSRQFLATYGPDESLYQSGISWDVTEADFWEIVNVEDVFSLRSWFPPLGGTGPKFDLYDFKLNEEELLRIKRQGFVVSEGLRALNFVDIYYRIFYRDLPVFISVDSVLHAWHRSYDAVLQELEADYLCPAIEALLSDLAVAVGQRDLSLYSPVIQQAFEHLDLYLSVARSLFANQQIDPVLPGSDAQMSEDIVAALIAAEGERKFSLFNDPDRNIDTTQYTPRGHYAGDPDLERYFRGMMWLGRLDLRLAGRDSQDGSVYELAAALVLNDLFAQSNRLDRLNSLNDLLEFMIGRTDALSLGEWSEMLSHFSAADLHRYHGIDDLQTLQKNIWQSGLGLSEISSRESLYTDPDFSSAELPVSLPVFGQRFTVDTWATSMVTEGHERLTWQGENLHRKVPSDLDVAFSVLGNTHAVPELVRRIEDNDGLAFRDGMNYQPHLAAVAQTVDQLNGSFWKGNMYNHWLYTLRALSEPSTGTEFPEVMRTATWAEKNMQTQLASWTQLRHDTLLHVKQPIVWGGACYYPDGYVEPKLLFWQRMAAMARQMATRLATLAPSILATATPEPKTPTAYECTFGCPDPAFDDGATRNIFDGSAAQFFTNFATRMDDLAEIARKQLNSEELSEDDRWYLENIVEITDYYLGPRTWSGWYPGLFYAGNVDSNSYDALVADVQTALPDPMESFPGNIHYQGVGRVNLMAIAIENEEDKVLYLGPVFSHYEMNQLYAGKRLNDDEWKLLFGTAEEPSHPAATVDYLVPGPARGELLWVWDSLIPD